MDKIVVDTKGERVDVFLSEKLQLSRSQIKVMFEKKQVVINGKHTKSGEKLKIGDIIEYQLLDTKLNANPEDIPIDIVFEDENIAVVNKPKGLVVHPAVGNKHGTLVNALVFHFNSLSQSDTIRPGIVHRLDKDTAGMLLIAKNDKAHDYLAKQISQKTCQRSYIALLVGQLSQDCGVIETGFGRSKSNRKKMAVYPIGEGKTAVTEYKVLKRYNGYCLVEFNLKTGRTHQIRVHSASLNHAIVGDTLYGGKSALYGGGQLLFAYKIVFKKPFDEQELKFELPLPDYFEKVLKKLN